MSLDSSWSATSRWKSLFIHFNTYHELTWRVSKFSFILLHQIKENLSRARGENSIWQNTRWFRRPFPSARGNHWLTRTSVLCQLRIKLALDLPCLGFRGPNKNMQSCIKGMERTLLTSELHRFDSPNTEKMSWKWLFNQSRPAHHETKNGVQQAYFWN